MGGRYYLGHGSLLYLTHNQSRGMLLQRVYLVWPEISLAGSNPAHRGRVYLGDVFGISGQVSVMIATQVAYVHIAGIDVVCLAVLVPSQRPQQHTMIIIC